MSKSNLSVDMESRHSGDAAAPDHNSLSKNQHHSDSHENEDIVVGWDGQDDPSNPFNWPTWKKRLVTYTACFVTFIVGVNSTSITSASEDISHRFNFSDEHFPNSFWPVTSWNAGAAVAPLVVLPLMEGVGVRTGYLINYTLFVLFIFPQAFAPNFATLIVTRLIAGGCGGVLQGITDGIIADVWIDDRARSLPIAAYAFSLIGGFTMGPVIGSAVNKTLYWRWIFHFQLIIYGALLPFVFFAIKETRAPVILSKRAKKIQKETGVKAYPTGEHSQPSITSILKDAVLRPTRLFFTEWIVCSFTMWSAFSFGIVFISTQSVAQVFKAIHGWSPFATGVVHSSMFIGELLGFIFCLYGNRIYYKSAKRNDDADHGIPEARLYHSIPASFVGLAGGLFWYAWTSYSSLPWILPVIGLGFVGFGIIVVVHAASVYLTDIYVSYAASAIAAMAFGENIIAAFVPLAAHSMYTNLGFQWASSLLGFVALVLSCAPVYLVFKGPKLRKKSSFAN